VTFHNTTILKSFQLNNFLIKSLVILLSCLTNFYIILCGFKFHSLLLLYFLYLTHKITFNPNYQNINTLKIFLTLYLLFRLGVVKAFRYIKVLFNTNFLKKTYAQICFILGVVFLNNRWWYPLFKKNSYYGYAKSVKTFNNFFKNKF